MTKRDEPETHDISAEEADRRMASAGSIPFSPEEIDAMVRSATAGLHIVSGDEHPSGSPDMRDETDDFWQELMMKVSEADSSPDLTMEEAEARMATADEAPFSDEEVETTVRSATEESPSRLRVLSDEPAPVHRNFFLRHARALTKVAALFLGMAMLYSVMTSPPIVFPGPEIWPEIGKAADTVINENAEIQDRLNALGLVANHARNGIRALKEAQQSQPGDVQAEAQRHVAQLHSVLDTNESYESLELTFSMEQLREIILERTNPLQQRLESLRTLAEQTRIGLLLLRRVQRETPESSLGEVSGLHLDLLISELR